VVGLVQTRQQAPWLSLFWLKIVFLTEGHQDVLQKRIRNNTALTCVTILCKSLLSWEIAGSVVSYKFFIVEKFMHEFEKMED